MVINPARFVTVNLCSSITGLTRSAINKRMGEGHWIEGRQWRRAEDGSIWIDMQAVERWVQGMP
ncbi:MAG: excisionase [Curvibacter sp.]|nr:MAG: excisionase [Curvibacter sp.]